MVSMSSAGPEGDTNSLQDGTSLCAKALLTQNLISHGLGSGISRRKVAVKLKAVFKLINISVRSVSMHVKRAGLFKPEKNPNERI
jgi:hypothetical protein